MEHDRDEDRSTNARRVDSRSKTTGVIFLVLGLSINITCVYICPQPAQFIFNNIHRIGEQLLIHGR
jgi:hypothetical protein